MENTAQSYWGEWILLREHKILKNCFGLLQIVVFSIILEQFKEREREFWQGLFNGNLLLYVYLISRHHSLNGHSWQDFSVHLGECVWLH